MNATETRAGNGDKEEFMRLWRRYTHLGRSFDARQQQERAGLSETLMKLYVALYPNSGYKATDDFDVVLRTHRRVA